MRGRREEDAEEKSKIRAMNIFAGNLCFGQIRKAQTE